MYVYLNHFAVHLKRTQYCRSTILQKKKKILSLILANTWKIGGSLSTVDEAGHRLKVSPDPQCDGVRRQDLGEVRHEDGALTKAISALTRETPQSCLVPYVLWGSGEKTAIYEQRSRSSPGTEPAGTLTSASRTVRNKFLITSHPV